MASPEEWFKNLPPITKTYLTSAVVTTALLMFGSISPQQIYINYELVFKRFEIWRLLTNFLFFGKFSFKFVFQMFILQSYMSMVETHRKYAGDRGRAEFIHMIIFMVLVLLLVGFLMGGLPFLGQPLIFGVLYIWSRIDPIREVNYWGFKFKAWHLPFVLVVVGMLMGNSPIMDLIGIITGHTYHFAMNIIPQVYGWQPLKCPTFLYNYFDQSNRQQQRARGMGTGYRLN